MTQKKKEDINILNVIGSDNYAVYHAAGPSPELSFHHTVNFSRYYGCPDLILFGLSNEQAIDIFDRIFVLHVRPHNGLLRQFGVAEALDYTHEEPAAYFNCDNIDIGSVVPGTTAKVLVPTQTAHWKTIEEKWPQYNHNKKREWFKARHGKNLRTHNLMPLEWLAKYTARKGQEAADIKRATRVAFVDIQGLVDDNDNDIITYHPKLLDALGFTHYQA